MDNIPESIKSHQSDYKPNTWATYTFQELGMWVQLLITRAAHRQNVAKREKDLYDASNYLVMMQAKLDSVIEELSK